MTTATRPEPATSVAASWRTPAVIVLCGCLIGLLTFGPRSAAGQFLTPLSLANGWGRDVFSMAFAIQNLLWGIGQPFAGAIADRFGTVRVLCGGALMYGLGLAIMAYATDPLTLDLSAGVLIGFGLAGSSFNLVLSAFGKLVPEEWRAMSLGAGTAAGSFGQFLFSPLARLLIDAFGWQQALLVFAAGMLLILPLSLALATPRASQGTGKARAAIAQAGAFGSLRASLLCAAGARLLHLRLPARLHHRASAGLSGRSRPLRRGRRLDHRGDRAVQHRRLAVGRAG